MPRGISRVRAMSNKDQPAVAVIGAGPAGMCAAIAAASGGAAVTVYEGNRDAGRKLRITGKGRCNITNDCTPQEFLGHVLRGKKFMYGPIFRFTPEDAINMMHDMGVETKTERGRRVFPVSDNANDVANALARRMSEYGVRTVRAVIDDVVTEDGRATGVRVGGELYPYDAVIVATGGMSYPRTGSTGDGYKFARKAGIKVTPLKPSLVPVVTYEDTADMMGLSLKNVTLTVKDKDGKRVFSELGEMLFTHFGLSGPLVLSATAHMQNGSVSDYTMSVDMKPALDEGELDRRLISDFAKYAVKDFANSLGDLLPSSLIPYIIGRSGIDPHTKTGAITREQRHGLMHLLKNLTFTPKSFRGIEEAIVTSGGVDTAELDPRTMMARRIGGLFFAGEVIDVDCYTGGYNLQVAYSTGMLAGEAAAAYGFEII